VERDLRARWAGPAFEAAQRSDIKRRPEVALHLDEPAGNR